MVWLRLANENVAWRHIGGKFERVNCTSHLEAAGDMERKVLFTFEGGKQVAALPPTDSTADLPVIKTLVKAAFDALADEDTSHIIIQGFDEDFEEWLDLKDTFVAEHKQKLKVVLRSSLKEPAKVCSTIHRMNYINIL